MKPIEYYREWLQARLSEKRYRHCLGVEKEAMKLAELYGCDAEKARYAGLLHDCTKEENYEKQLQLAANYGILLGIPERNCPKILHEITGAAYVEKELGIGDTDILDGIAHHSTGRGGMSTFEKIIFLADLSEENRKFPDVEAFRQLVYTDLDKAMLYALNTVLGKMLEQNGYIYPATVEARNDLLLKS